LLNSPQGRVSSVPRRLPGAAGQAIERVPRMGQRCRSRTGPVARVAPGPQRTEGGEPVPVIMLEGFPGRSLSRVSGWYTATAFATRCRPWSLGFASSVKVAPARSTPIAPSGAVRTARESSPSPTRWRVSCGRAGGMWCTVNCFRSSIRSTRCLWRGRYTARPCPRRLELPTLLEERRPQSHWLTQGLRPVVGRLANA